MTNLQFSSSYLSKKSASPWKRGTENVRLHISYISVFRESHDNFHSCMV